MNIRKATGLILIFPMILGVMLSACGGGNGGSAEDPASVQKVRSLATSAGLDGDPVGTHPVPAKTDPKFILGRALFFSSKMSGSGDISCGSCHQPLFGQADGLSLAVGVEPSVRDVAGPGRVQNIATSLDPRNDGGPNMSRNVITLFNASLFDKVHFYDGRIFTLGDGTAPNGAGQPVSTPESPFRVGDPNAGHTMLQTLVQFPVTTLVEMRGFSAFQGIDRGDYRAKLADRFAHTGDNASEGPTPWLPLFQNAFGPGTAAQLITYDNITKAVEAYIQAQTFVDTPWKHFLAGNDTALSASARRGAKLFFTPPEQGGANCFACHTGDLFTDEQFHILAIPQIGRGFESQQDDFGRYAVSLEEKDRYAYRTPSLLNVAVTAPYGHDGAYPTLQKIIRHHLNPAAAVDSYDFAGFSDAPQLQGLGATYPFSEANTRKALAALNARHDPKLVRPITVSDSQLNDLVTFLDEGLTDPCVKNLACTANLVPDPADGPDSSVMALGFSTFADGLAARAPRPVVTRVGPDSSTPLGPVVTRCVPTYSAPATAATWGFSEEAAVDGLPASGPMSIPFPLNNDLQFIELMNFSGGVAPVDINGDCLMDLYVVKPFSGPNRLYVADGTGRYQEEAALYGLDLQGGYSSVAFADMDGDGDEDLLAGKSQDGSPELWVRSGNSFALSPQSVTFKSKRNSFGFSVGDIDNDNDLDVFIAYWDFDQVTPDNHLWLNNGDGTFVAGDAYYGLAGAFLPFEASFSPGMIDFDNDGLLDILLTSDQRQSKVFHNVGGESLVNTTNSQVITDTNGMGTAIADFDGDGDPDWFVTSIDAATGTLPWTADGNRLYRNMGDGTFTDATDAAGVRHGAWGWGACAADFNNDGIIDIFHTNGFGVWDSNLLAALTVPSAHFISQYLAFNNPPNRMFIGNGDGTFTNKANLVGVDGTVSGLGVVCMDADNDGDIDIYVGTVSGQPEFYRNNASGMPNAHSLNLILEGRYPNSRALGSKVVITAAGHTQTQWVTMNSNFNSTNPSQLHFGLGAATSADVTITWPTGQVSTSTAVSADSFHAIAQP